MKVHRLRHAGWAVAWVVAAILSCALPAAARWTADDLPGELSGSVGVESRVFLSDAQFPGQGGDGVDASVVAQPEWYLDWNSGDDAVLFIPFGRLDSDDSRRTHFDLRELNYLHVGDRWELRVGFAKVFWGVTEAQHLVDIINQDDAIEDVDGEDKLGQPMVHGTLLRDFGTLELFVLPGFRERTFAGRHGRLRPSVVIDTDDVDYEADLGQANVDGALRFSFTLGDVDVGLSHFYGTGRDPRFALRVHGDELITAANALDRLRLAPRYDLIHQSGIDAQYTGDNVLLKLEAIGRAGQGDYRVATVAGFEYTFYALFQSEIDVGVIGEFLYDSFRTPSLPSIGDLPAQGVPPQLLVDDQRFGLEAPPTPFEHDVFSGFRMTFNDVQSTELLAGVIVDVEDGSRFWTVEAARRLGDRFKVSLDLRRFDGFDDDSFFASIGQDDFVQLQIARYF